MRHPSGGLFPVQASERVLHAFGLTAWDLVAFSTPSPFGNRYCRAIDGSRNCDTHPSPSCNSVSDRDPSLLASPLTRPRTLYKHTLVGYTYFAQRYGRLSVHTSTIEVAHEPLLNHHRRAAWRRRGVGHWRRHRQGETRADV